MGSFVFIECESKSSLVPFLFDLIKKNNKDIKCILIKKGWRSIFYLYFPFSVDRRMFKSLSIACYSFNDFESFYRSFPLVEMFGESKISTNDFSFWDEFFSLSYFYNRGLLSKSLNF